MAFTRLVKRYEARAAEADVSDDDRAYATERAEQAKKVNAARPVRVELSLPEGVTVQSGKIRTEVGHLEGRAARLGVTSVWTSSPTDNRAKAEWVVHAPDGGELTLPGRSLSWCATSDITCIRTPCSITRGGSSPKASSTPR